MPCRTPRWSSCWSTAFEIGYAPGEYVFREGEPADAIYILASGRAVTLKAWDGLYLLVSWKPELFREMALMDMNHAAPRY